LYRVGEGRAYWSLGNALTALGQHKDALNYAMQHLLISKEVSFLSFLSTQIICFEASKVKAQNDNNMTNAVLYLLTLFIYLCFCIAPQLNGKSHIISFLKCKQNTNHNIKTIFLLFPSKSTKEVKLTKRHFMDEFQFENRNLFKS